MSERAAIDEASFAGSDQLGAAAPVACSDRVVMKFGGTSVSSAGHWETIAGLLQNRLDAGLKPVLVHSALAGVSTALEVLITTARDGGDPAPGLEAIRAQHFRLAAELGIDPDPVLSSTLQELADLLAGARRGRQVSPAVYAQIVGLGEILATRLGAAYLARSGIDVHWQDAREVLVSEHHARRSRLQNYLSATCDYSPDPDLAARFDAIGRVVLVPGYIASNRDGETVLLGREGSDTSAAYIAAKLQARRVEIWTDVPGMFTADPRLVPSARLLVALRFDEAQELASTGSRVLHPRCLSPLRDNGIPLFIRCTDRPAVSGTVVAALTEETGPQVKGISARTGVTLVSMQSASMWHEVGFLADAFAAFARHGVSVDLVSTSETNVTVSIDTVDQHFSAEVRQGLVDELQQLCRVRLIPDCAEVSLVGDRIRTILPRLAPALAVFEEERIHLVSQAANDLNFSFVIDQDQTAKLVGKLHASIIGSGASSTAFGPSWEELNRDRAAVAQRESVWWLEKRDRLLEIAAEAGSAYVYDAENVAAAAAGLHRLPSIDRVLYAVKANFNPRLLRVLADAGVDFDCVSPAEVEHVKATVPGIGNERILFTPNFAPREEYAWAVKQRGLTLTLDNLYPLQAWPDVFAGQRLFIRVDPGQGRGHHEHVRTAGIHSKFGIPAFEMDELEDLLAHAGATVVGIHAHSGSGILDPDNWRSVAEKLVRIADRFPEADVLDLGGGLGVPERPADPAFDLESLEALLAEFRSAHPDYRLWLEPGRYLVARAGVLLSRVTQVKGKGDVRYVGVGTGMNSLIRPALYGAYHEIVNLTRIAEPATQSVTVVGPICESGDKLGSDRLLPESSEDDVLLIANAGAYGYVMGSRYNLREVAEEVVI